MYTYLLRLRKRRKVSLLVLCVVCLFVVYSGKEHMCVVVFRYYAVVHRMVLFDKTVKFCVIVFRYSAFVHRLSFERETPSWESQAGNISGKRDSIHHHLPDAISETANVLELRQKLLYTTPSGWWGCIESVFRISQTSSSCACRARIARSRRALMISICFIIIIIIIIIIIVITSSSRSSSRSSSIIFFIITITITISFTITVSLVLTSLVQKLPSSP